MLGQNLPTTSKPKWPGHTWNKNGNKNGNIFGNMETKAETENKKKYHHQPFLQIAAY